MAPLWLCAAAAAGLAAASEPPLGVAPEDAARYPAGPVFTCHDGLAEFPAGAVNDDFCDCADGSDEPGTAACAGRAGARFYCRNLGSVPRLLYSSRVRDGICDCCDGSDERAGRCGNTCEAEGALVQAERARRRSAIMEGLRIMEESQADVKSKTDAWRSELATVDKVLAELESTRAETEQEAQRARLIVEEARQAQVEESGLLLSETFEDEEAPSRWSRAEGGGSEVVEDPLGQRGKVLAMRKCTWGGDAFSLKNFSCSVRSKCKISFWARGQPWQGFSRGAKRTEEPLADAHSWLAVPAASGDFPDRLASLQGGEDWAKYHYEFPGEDAFQMFGNEDVTFASTNVHIMLQAHSSTGQCEKTMFDDIRVWKENSVMFFDTDGDKVELKLNEAGGMDVYANGELTASDIKEFSTEGRYVHFGGYRSLAPNEETVQRCQSLWDRRLPGAAVPEEASAPSEPAQEASEKGPEISEYAKWALNQDAPSAEAQPGPEETAGEEDSAEEGAPEEETEPDAPEPGSKTWSRVQSKAGGSEAEQALSELEKALQDAKEAVKRKKNLREDLERKLQQVEGNPRGSALVDTCVEKHFQDYLYKICFFGEGKQDHVVLGRFKDWESGSAPVLLFEDGDYCPGGPARSLKVRLICGPEGSLLDVSEPSRCSYEAQVVHPSACRREDLAELDAPAHARVLRPHEEL